MKLQNFFLFTALAFSTIGCTAQVQNTVENSPSPTVITLPSPTPTSSSTPTATSSPAIHTATPSAKPSPTTKVSVESKSEVKSYSTSTSNSSTNISINSNGTSVKMFTKDGKRYAELNGNEVEIDANGCYDYNEGGTTIRSCLNN